MIRFLASIAFIGLTMAGLAGITVRAGEALVTAHWVIFATMALGGLMATAIFITMFRTLRIHPAGPRRPRR